MASIRRKGRKWYIKFYWQGESFERALGVGSKKNALELKRIIEFDVACGRLDPDRLLGRQKERLYLSEAIRMWLVDCQRRSKGMSGITIEQYGRSSAFLSDVIGEVAISEITRNDVERVVSFFESNYQSIGSIRHHLTNCRSFFSYLVKEGFLTKNWFSGLVPKPLRKLPVFFHEKENRAIKDFYLNHRSPWRPGYFLTLHQTGNRKSEHFNLKWSKNVFLDQAFVKFPGKGRYQGKERIVPLTDFAIDVFRRIPRKLGNDRVFWHIKSIYTIDSAWQDDRERIGIDYTLHNFRSNRASWLVMKGVAVEKVMLIMGWNDYETYKLYAGLSPDFINQDRNVAQL